MYSMQNKYLIELIVQGDGLDEDYVADMISEFTVDIAESLNAVSANTEVYMENLYDLREAHQINIAIQEDAKEHIIYTSDVQPPVDLSNQD